MIDWIIKTFFLEEATRLGSMDAFKKAHADIMETMADDLDDKAEQIAKDKMANLLGVVGINNVISQDRTKAIYVNNEKIDDTRLANLRAEAQFFAESDLWTLIHDTPKELAEQFMFNKGESLADMQKGRSILYTLSTQRNIIELLRK